jgi:glycosyltransferase involved in cell wall biosynthesis
MKVVFIISNIDRWMTFEWMTEGLAQDFDLHFILLNSGHSYFEEYLKKSPYSYNLIDYSGKTSIPTCVWKVKKILCTQKPHIVHTHFLDANLVGLTAAWLAGVPKRIQTRHHSVFHHRYSKKGVLYDLYCNARATHIIAISQIVSELLKTKEKVPAKKVHLVHHGFDFSVFNRADPDYIQQFMSDNRLSSGNKIIGVISRYIDWKGVDYIVKAFGDFQKNHPEAILVLLNARGPAKQRIQEALAHLPTDSYREVVFEKNILDIFSLFSVFVHTPIDREVEAFGQVYVEALASQIPSIFTLSGVANEFVKHKENAWVVNHQDANAIQEALEKIWLDTNLKNHLIENGLESVKIFGINDFCKKLKDIYEA